MERPGSSGDCQSAPAAGFQMGQVSWDAEAQAKPTASRSLDLEPAKSNNGSLKTDYEEEDAEQHRHGMER